MEEIVDKIASELETVNSHDSDSHFSISASTLTEIQTLFEDDEEAERLFSIMTLRNISPSTLIHSVNVSMDSSDLHISLLASHVYLSILISPASPLYTLFTPINFLSLLKSLRHCFKHQGLGSQPHTASDASSKKNQRKRKARHQKLAVDNNDDNNNTFEINIQLLFTILEKTEALLHRIHLQRFPDVLKALVDNMGVILLSGTALYQNSAHFHKFSNLCLSVLLCILSPDHGDQTMNAIEVLRTLAPAVLMQKSRVRTVALQFLTCQVMTKAKEVSAIKKAVVYFPRYLVAKAPDKSEQRASAVESVMDIVKALEYEDQIGFADYVVKMTEGKAQLRLVAVDLIPLILMSLSRPGLGEGEDSWDIRCLKALIRRCSDSSAGVRARALSNMASVVGFLSEEGRHLSHLREVIMIGSGGLNNLLRKRCQDDKAAVKKAALLLIMKSTMLMSNRLDEEMLRLIGTACSDPLVSIRKAGLSTLSEIFRKFFDSRVVLEWLRAVPCLITDNECSIQAESESLFQELVLDRIHRVGCASICTHMTIPLKDPEQNFECVLESAFPEGVLTILKGLCDGEVAPCVKKICSSLGKKKQLKCGIAVALQNIISTSEALWLSYSQRTEKWTAPLGSWFLLSEVSPFLPKSFEWKFLQHHWTLLDKVEPEYEVHSPLPHEEAFGCIDGLGASSVAWVADRVFLLQTISNVSAELPPEPAADLAQNLLQRIEGFNMHPVEVNAHVKTLRTLCKRKAAITERGDSLVAKCVGQLLSKALHILNNYMSEVDKCGKNNLLTPPMCGNTRERVTGSRSLSRAVIAVFTIGSLVLVCPSADLKKTLPALHTIITSGCPQPKPKELAEFTISTKQVAPPLYVHSWLTMGKICLADGKLAKRYIPLFVQELERSDSAALRNNIMVTLTDFCVRYTALVDCYIPRITTSLRDPCEVVRRQTFILLSRLLQRDYVKWRGILFLRFLLSLVDESDKIRQLADFLFGNILKAKAPLLAYNSFIEAIFVLNDCRAPAGHSESQCSRHVRRLFSVRGNDNDSRLKRMHIYSTLLKQMAPEHLLATSAKLCTEILAAASDGLLNLHDAAAQCVLQDALEVLGCKEMHIPFNRGLTSSDIGDVDAEGGEAVASTRGRMVTQETRKNLIQNAVPIFIELKRILEGMNSPLIGCLMECLRMLLKDYKTEIDDILVADPQLRKELLYDMQKYEATKAKSMAEEAMANVQKSASKVILPFCGNASAVDGKTVGKDSHVRINIIEKAVDSLTMASAVADVAAEATARSVLKEVNQNAAASPLHAISIPKLKSGAADAPARYRHQDVLESLRRRQSFDPEEEP